MTISQQPELAFTTDHRYLSMKIHTFDQKDTHGILFIFVKPIHGLHLYYLEPTH